MEKWYNFYSLSYRLFTVLGPSIIKYKFRFQGQNYKLFWRFLAFLMNVWNKMVLEGKNICNVFGNFKSFFHSKLSLLYLLIGFSQHQINFRTNITFKTSLIEIAMFSKMLPFNDVIVQQSEKVLKLCLWEFSHQVFYEKEFFIKFSKVEVCRRFFVKAKCNLIKWFTRWKLTDEIKTLTPKFFFSSFL